MGDIASVINRALGGVLQGVVDPQVEGDISWTSWNPVSVHDLWVAENILYLYGATGCPQPHGIFQDLKGDFVHVC